jgi:hypothetical protein
MPSNWSRYPQPIGTVKQRLLKRCRQEDRGYVTPCLIWMGEKDKEGYGKIKDGGKYVPAHWVLAGAPPEGMQKDHLCHQRDCVRPSHLEDVTPSENTLRRLSLPALSEKSDKEREDRRKVALTLLAEGVSITEVARQTGLSRRTIGRMKKDALGST